MAVLRPDLMMKNVVPVVMAGIIAVSYQKFFEPSVGLHCHFEDLWPRRLGPYFWKSYVFPDSLVLTY